MKAIVRVLVGLLCRVIGMWDIRYRWLSHYLVGDGSSLIIPNGVVAESLDRETAEYWAGEPYKFDSARRLFWLVGTMTWEIVESRVVGTDRYDWHQNRLFCPVCGGWDIEDGECVWCEVRAVRDWWWSPTPFPGIIARVLRAVWPACREYVAVGDNGRLAVSNGFWPFLGGREFDSLVDVPMECLPEY